MVDEEHRRVGGVDRPQDARIVGDVPGAGDREGHEPQRHHRPEEGRDLAGAAALDHEQPDEDGERDRHDVVGEGGGCDLEALDGREHRDRRRDHRVAVEQAGADGAEQQHLAAAARAVAERALGERHERQRAALAVVVGAEQDDDVFDRHDEDQRPQDQRQDAEDDLARHRPAGGRGRDRFLQRVERARADVAVDDADRAERERPEAGLVVALGGLARTARLLFRIGRSGCRCGGVGVPWDDGFGLSHDALCVTRPGCLQRRPEEKRRRRRCDPSNAAAGSRRRGSLPQRGEA